MDELQEKYTLLVAQNEVLRKENAELKSLLCAHGIQYKLKSSEEVAPVYSSISLPTINLSLDERVTLFMSLFKGREDVFARRWFSKATGNGGYQPVCVNEWRRGVCDKRAYKCAECPNRNFAPLTQRDIYQHLEGKDDNCCDVEMEINRSTIAALCSSVLVEPTERSIPC